MEIKKIKYEGVYGTLSETLNFKRGENFIVGINGCGKTTVLNLIRWMLGPCLPDLLTLDHEFIELDIKHEKYMYSIQSKMLEGKHELTVKTKDKKRNFQPIITSLIINPKNIGNSVEAAKEQYEGLSPEEHEVETWSFLYEELPDPVFIGLERSVGESDRVSTLRKRKRALPDSISPINVSHTLMRDAYNSTRRRAVEINDELNYRVMELSFSGVLSGKFRGTAGTIKDTAKKIKRLKNRFEDTANKGSYSKTLSSMSVRAAVIKYLDDLSAILDESNKEDEILITLNQHNFDRAAKMFDLFEDHEKNIRESQKDIHVFVNTVNRFISESGKSINFNEDTGAPYFTSKASSETLKISDLSSGEAQIIILMSYFAFLAKKGMPIIIDEPELSLHVQWQKYFVDAIKSVMPAECQTIMATHSPEICGADDVNVQSISIKGL